MHREKTKRFISKAVGKYGRRYSYENTVYVRSSAKIAITCRAHGTFWQTPNAHLSGAGCPDCGRERSRRRSSTEEFISKAEAVHNGKYSYASSVYVRSDEKLVITCGSHGDFSQSPNAHLSGRGCPECGLSRRSLARRKVRGFKSDRAARSRASVASSVISRRWL